MVVDFLGRPTAFIAGTEEIARKFKMPVLYFDTRCEARGYYVSRIALLSEDASLEQKGRLTEKYAQYLEYYSLDVDNCRINTILVTAFLCKIINIFLSLLTFLCKNRCLFYALFQKFCHF